MTNETADAGVRDVVSDEEIQATIDEVIRADNFSRNWRQLKRHNPRGWTGHQPAWLEWKINE